MAKSRVRKVLVCPECGREIRAAPASTATIEAEVLPDEEGIDAVVTPETPSAPIETVFELGPVCPRCASG